MTNVVHLPCSEVEPGRAAAPKRNKKKSAPAPLPLKTYEIMTNVDEGELCLRFRVKRTRRPSLTRQITGLIARQTYDAKGSWTPFTDGAIAPGRCWAVWEVVGD